MNKKILIVGGCGYIGGYLTDILSSDKNNEVVIYDNLMYESRFFKNINFIRGDVRDTKKLGSIINKYDIDKSQSINNNLETLSWDLYLYRENIK